MLAMAGDPCLLSPILLRGMAFHHAASKLDVGPVDSLLTQVHTHPMTRTDVLPLKTILSVSYIQSKTWIFATEQGWQLFNRAVALLPDVDWATEEKDVPSLGHEFAKALGLRVPNKFGTTLGIRSRYHLVIHFSGDYGQIVLACVLAMSRQEHPIMALQDTEAGAQITSYLPMNRWTWSGALTLNIDATDKQYIAVEGNAIVPGQVFDWFRCRRVVNRTLQEAHKYLAAMGNANSW